MTFIALLKRRIDMHILFPALGLITYKLCWGFMLMGGAIAAKTAWVHFGFGLFLVGVAYLVFTVICGMTLAMLRESRRPIG